MDFFVFLAAAVFGLGVVVAVLVAVRQQSRRANEAMRDAGHRLGLSAEGTTGGYVRLKGAIGSCRVDVKIKPGQNNQRETRYEITYPPVPVDFRFTAANRMTRLLPTAVTGDVEIGDVMFDDAVIVRTADPAAVAAHMNAARRQSVLIALRNHRGLSVSSGELEWRVPGTPGTGEEVVAAVGRLLGLASTLGVTGIAPGSTRPVAMPAALSGTLGYPPIPSDSTTSRPGRGRPMARDPFDVPRQPSSAGPTSAPPARPARGDADENAGPAEADDLVARMGGYMTGLLPTYQVERRFAESDLGARVRGAGTVGRMHRFTFDLDFGDGPAVKAMVNVDVPGSASPLRVALRLPDETHLERGSRVAFEGDLAKVTPIVRSVFLDNVTLL